MAAPRKRGSVCDETARRRLTIKSDVGELYDTTPASVEAKYPLLHGRLRDIDDLVLQEVYLVMFQRCDIGTTPYSNWSNVPQSICVFELAPTGPSLVGGMLFASGQFLFGDMPFVRNRVKDVRCRLEFDAGTEGGLGWLYGVPQPPAPSGGGRGPTGGGPTTTVPKGSSASSPKSPTTLQESSYSSSVSKSVEQPDGVGASVELHSPVSPGSPPHGSSFAAKADPPKSPSTANNGAASSGIGIRPAVAAASVPPPRLPPNVHVSGSGVATCRVFFRVEEFECMSMPWVVQRFQLVDPNTNAVYGPVFARAFQPYDSATAFISSPLRNSNGGGGGRRSLVGAEGDGGRSLEIVASTQFGVGIPMSEMRRAKRKAVAGEERLRILKPHLYHWCLERNPSDLGAGATVIKEVLLYFRHTFSVVRTIRLLMKAVRRLQTACRRMIDRRRKAYVRMLTEWTALERQVEAQLMDYEPVANDPVDATVFAVLKENIITSEALKAAVIADLYAQRQAERLTLSKEQRNLFAARYRFFIQPSDLLAESHRRLVERLCRTDDSPIFKDPRIKEELRDRTMEKLQKKLLAQAAEQKRLERARNKGTFGTSARLLLYPNHPTRGMAATHCAGDATLKCRGGVKDGLTPAVSPSLLRSPHPPPSSPHASSPPASPKSRCRPSPGKKKPPSVRQQYLDVLDELFDDA